MPLTLLCRGFHKHKDCFRYSTRQTATFYGTIPSFAFRRFSLVSVVITASIWLLIMCNFQDLGIIIYWEILRGITLWATFVLTMKLFACYYLQEDMIIQSNRFIKVFGNSWNPITGKHQKSKSTFKTKRRYEKREKLFWF